AEDGIRDKLVTGVQTCALPISQRQSTAIARLGFFESAARSQRNAEIGMGQGEVRYISEQPLVKNERLIDLAGMVMPHRFGKEPRSEERRVGKECGSGGARGDER